MNGNMYVCMNVLLTLPPVGNLKTILRPQRWRRAGPRSIKQARIKQACIGATLHAACEVVLKGTWHAANVLEQMMHIQFATTGESTAGA
jgi:hypothetical protein